MNSFRFRIKSRRIALAGQHNTDKMERMNAEIRDRERVTVIRNLKVVDSPILTELNLS